MSNTNTTALLARCTILRADMTHAEYLSLWHRLGEVTDNMMDESGAEPERFGAFKERMLEVVGRFAAALDADGVPGGANVSQADVDLLDTLGLRYLGTVAEAVARHDA